MSRHDSFPARNAFDLVRPLRRLAAPVESFLVRRFGRSVLSTAFRVDVLVLHTVGRRSGTARSTPLAYARRDGALFVVGGAGGQARTPDWVANLRAEPRAAVTVDRRRLDVVAEELVGEERADVWGELALVWPRITAYERRARRPVPVFRLRQASAPRSGSMVVSATTSTIRRSPSGDASGTRSISAQSPR